MGRPTLGLESVPLDTFPLSETCLFAEAKDQAGCLSVFLQLDPLRAGHAKGPQRGLATLGIWELGCRLPCRVVVVRGTGYLVTMEVF